MRESMHVKTKSPARRSIGQWCQDFWTNIDGWRSSLARFIYNREQREILGRDGKRWSKLAAFYFFFYMALGGFFCLCLSLYMSLLPLDRPRYVGKASCLTSRSNPLSPGLSFQPLPKVQPKDMHAVVRLGSSNTRRGKRAVNEGIDSYVKKLDEFLNDYYSTPSSQNYTISDVGDCHSSNQYGFKHGKPCFLLKMNKIVDFVPEIRTSDAGNTGESVCSTIANIPLRCQGEKASDQDKLGTVIYYSESGSSDVCGSFDVKHFPYKGKINRKDVYQTPYVWVQFANPTSDVLISVECRVYGANIYYNKMAQRGSVRFQLYLNKNP